MVGQAWCFCQFVACSLPPQKRGFAKVPVLWSCFHISWIKVHMLEGKANKIQDRLIQEAPPQKKVNAVVA